MFSKQRAGLRVVVTLALALALTGCFESRQDFTINPDGSGKMVHEATFARVGMLGQDERPSLDEQLQSTVKDLLSNSSGVEAWRDVTFRRLPDGRMYFKGTAYFRDLGALRISNQAVLRFAAEKQAGGGLILTGAGSEETEATAKEGELADQDAAKLAGKIARERARYQDSRPLLAGMTSTLHQEVTLRLPGEITSASNFQKAGDRMLKIQFGGPKILAAVDELNGSDEWWRKRVRTNTDAPSLGMDFSDLELNARLFGEKAPIRATIAADGQPQFDYAKEVAVAKAEYAALTQRLGIKLAGNGEEGLASRTSAKARNGERSESPAPPEGLPLKNVRVTGARFVFDKQGVPMGFGREKALTLALQGDLPAEDLHASAGEILVATAPDGSDLRLKSTSIELNQFSVRQSEDRKILTWELTIALPPANAAALKEVSGYIAYVVPGATRKTDFGLGELKAGAAGKEFDARLEAFEQPAGGRLGGLTLRLKAGVWRVRSLNVLDAAGRVLKLTHGSTSYSDLSTTYKYTWAEALPPGARIEAEIYDPLETRRASFRLEQVPVMGQP